MTLTAAQLSTIAAVAAVIIPPVVSLLKRENWPAGVKQVIALAASVAASIVGVAVTVTDWSAVNIAVLAGLAYTGSQVVYQAYFRGSAFDSTLTALPQWKKTAATATPVEPAPVEPTPVAADSGGITAPATTTPAAPAAN